MDLVEELEKYLASQGPHVFTRRGPENPNTKFGAFNSAHEAEYFRDRWDGEVKKVISAFPYERNLARVYYSIGTKRSEFDGSWKKLFEFIAKAATE